jgi:hypothetical protein
LSRYGEERIRTSVRCDPKADFESAAFNHSATSPEAQKAIIANSEPVAIARIGNNPLWELVKAWMGKIKYKLVLPFSPGFLGLNIDPEATFSLQQTAN